MAAVAQKKDPNEMVAVALDLERRVPQDSFAQSLPYYRGSIFEFDPQTLRPIDFIGPLRHVFLPNSLQRRIMWLARMALPSEVCEDLFPTLPGVEVIKRVSDKEPIIFHDERETSVRLYQDCFDYAMRDEEFYLYSSRRVESYIVMRRGAFKRPSSPFFEPMDPSRLLRKMGYRPVQEANVGDLVVYFLDPFSPENNASFKDNSPSHYGRVVEIRNGTLIIESRIETYIYHHELEYIRYPYGNSYLLFSKRVPFPQD